MCACMHWLRSVHHHTALFTSGLYRPNVHGTGRIWVKVYGKYAPARPVFWGECDVFYLELRGKVRERHKNGRLSFEKS